MAEAEPHGLELSVGVGLSVGDPLSVDVLHDGDGLGVGEVLVGDDGGVLLGGVRGLDGRVYDGRGESVGEFFGAGLVVFEPGFGGGLDVDPGGGLTPRGLPGSTGGSFGLCFGGPCVGSGDVGRIGTLIPTSFA